MRSSKARRTLSSITRTQLANTTFNEILDLVTAVVYFLCVFLQEHSAWDFMGIEELVRSTRFLKQEI